MQYACIVFPAFHSEWMAANYTCRKMKNTNSLIASNLHPIGLFTAALFELDERGESEPLAEQRSPRRLLRNFKMRLLFVP